MKPGAVVVINRHFQSDAGRWQTTDSTGDNYISIGSTNPAARFVVTTEPWSGMHGGFRGAAPQLAFRLEGAELEDGVSFTVTYGDTSGGSQGYRVQTYSNDAAPFPIHIKFAPDDIFFSFPIATYKVVGSMIAEFQGFAPSIVSLGERFSMSVRAEDKYRNRAEGAIPKVIVTLNGEPFGKLTGVNRSIHVVSDIQIEKPGTYRFSYSSEDGQFTGMSNPIWVRENPENRIYWGETHGHSGFAEGLGTADAYFKFGRDDARLDFLTLSEHDIWMDDYEWDTINRLSKKYTEPGRFIAFPGYEWTSPRARGGHHNVFFNGYDFDRVPVQDAHYLSDLYFQLREKYDPSDVLIIPHAHQAGDWRENDVYMERLVELMSMHGTFEWFGKKYLEHGSQVGFVGASDDHLGHPGYTSGNFRWKQQGGLAAVMAESLTGDDLFSSLRNRSAYATSGDRIILEATLNGYGMGTRQSFIENRKISGTAKGTSPIIEIDLIKNGDVIDTHEYIKTSMRPHSFIQIGFESESEVFEGRDNPRGYRPWIGWFEVSNARIKSISTPGFHNLRVEWARIDPENPQRVNISTATRGRINNMVLELDGVSADTSIRVVLNETKEVGTAPVRIREFARIPGADLQFAFSDMTDGSLAHEFRVGRHTDRLSLSVIDPSASMDRGFTFEDDSDPAHGDYYYIRVRQLNGGTAWSSPFWVGGEPRS